MFAYKYNDLIFILDYSTLNKYVFKPFYIKGQLKALFYKRTWKYWSEDTFNFFAEDHKRHEVNLTGIKIRRCPFKFKYTPQCKLRF